jgi:hypothetical protein
LNSKACASLYIFADHAASEKSSLTQPVANKSTTIDRSKTAIDWSGGLSYVLFRDHFAQIQPAAVNAWKTANIATTPSNGVKYSKTSNPDTIAHVSGSADASTGNTALINDDALPVQKIIRDDNAIDATILVKPNSHRLLKNELRSIETPRKTAARTIPHSRIAK